MSGSVAVALTRGAWEQQVAVAGISMEPMLSATVFRSRAELPSYASHEAVAEQAHERWRRLAEVLAASPEPFEAVLVTEGAQDGRPARKTFFVVGRSGSVESALGEARSSAASLLSLLKIIVDQADWAPVDDESRLRELAAPLFHAHVLELSRDVPSAPAELSSYADDPARESAAPNGTRLAIDRGDWPLDDESRALVLLLAWRDAPCAFAVHVRGGSPDRGGAEGRDRGAATPATSHRSRAEDSENRWIPRAVEARGSMVRGRLAVARVFLLSPSPPPRELVAAARVVVAATRASHGLSEDRACVTRVSEASGEDVMSAFGEPHERALHLPEELACLLRGPAPSDAVDFPLPTRGHRMAGTPRRRGGDATLGESRRCSVRTPVSLDAEARFRHVYVVGKTGAGKSTLLSRMILEDVRRGRGVVVLDPHGSLVQEVLRHMPAERCDDVVVIDPLDRDFPVGLNPLCVEERDPVRYREQRDRAIDDLLGYLEGAFDMRRCGGPVFESYLRGMLVLAMGAEAPPRDRVPSLLLLRRMFADPKLRAALAAVATRHADPVAAAFLQEVESTSGDLSLKNVAAYITSKFSRATDTSLRNVLCQRSTIDFVDAVRRRKIVLCDLGRGRLARFESELLAHQVVSRARNAAWTLAAQGEPAPVYVYADEFAFLARSAGFAEMLAECRKTRVALTLAHQHTGQVAGPVLDALLGNVGTVVALKVGPADADLLAPLYAPKIGAADLAGQPLRHAYVATSCAGDDGDDVWDVRLSAAPDGGCDDRAAAVRESSRRRCGTPREVAERAILESLESFGRAAADSPTIERDPRGSK